MIRLILRHHARLLILVPLLTLALAVESVVVTASASHTASVSKKCKHGRKGKRCNKKKKATKARIRLTNCPTADLTPNVPYTFTGRVVPGGAGIAIVIQYFDQGSQPLAVHRVNTARDGSFSDTYAYPPSGTRRGGTVRANSTSAIDPICQVTIAEM